MKSPNLTPATPEQTARAREVEERRKVLDPHYISAEDAAAVPDELKGDPALLSRVRYSEPDWPERNVALSQAFPPGSLPGGEGQTTEDRSRDGGDFIGAAAPSGKIGGEE